MPKTNEELESELLAIGQKLVEESAERVKLLEKLNSVTTKASELESVKTDLLKRIESAESVKSEIEKLKLSQQAKPSEAQKPPKEEEPVEDIDSLLSDDDKKVADDAFNKLSDDHQQWVLSGKKNRAEFLSDILGKGKASKPRSLFQSGKPTNLSIRDQIRQALNLESAETIPPGGPGVRTPSKSKPASQQEQEVVTSLSNGDVLGALKNKKK